VQEYLFLEFPSETTTRSGYNIKRRNFVVAALKRDKLYVLSARCGLSAWLYQLYQLSKGVESNQAYMSGCPSCLAGLGRHAIAQSGWQSLPDAEGQL
jgi:hypothetical protein